MTCCAVESFTVKMAWPLAFVAADAGVIVELPVPAVSVTVLPLMRLLNASDRVTVTVDVVAPSAGKEVGLAAMLEMDALGTAAFTVKLLLVAPVSAPSVADSVKLPAAVGTRLLNVATPAEAGTVRVEPALRVPPLLMAIVTLDEFPLTTLPKLSSTDTVTDGEMEAPALVVLGCAVKASLVAVVPFTVSVCVADVMVLGEVLAAVIVGVPALVSV